MSVDTALEYYKKGTSQCDGINNISKHQLGKAIDIICYDLKTNKPTYNKKEIYQEETNTIEESLEFITIFRNKKG